VDGQQELSAGSAERGLTRSVPFRFRTRAAPANSIDSGDWRWKAGERFDGRQHKKSRLLTCPLPEFQKPQQLTEGMVMSDPAADADRVWTLISDVPVAMVVTHDGQGQHMRARPMAIRPAQQEGAIYFLTDVDAPKAREIRRNDTICLALADNKSQKYVSITGRAEIIDDQDRVEEIWSIYDRAFWPDKSDPRIRVLRVTPESAEFWEGAGAVVTAVKLVAAGISGERVNLGKNEKVGFGS
jgi:general stress protein 26